MPKLDGQSDGQKCAQRIPRFALQRRAAMDAAVDLQLQPQLLDSHLCANVTHVGIDSHCVSSQIAADTRHRPDDGDETIYPPTMAISVLSGDYAIPTATVNKRQPIVSCSHLAAGASVALET